MHFDGNTITLLFQAAAVGIGAWIASRLKKPADHERAQMLATVAKGAAMLARASYPTATWSTVLNETVNQITASAAAPTLNKGAILRAAAAALGELGVKPA